VINTDNMSMGPGLLKALELNNKEKKLKHADKIKLNQDKALKIKNPLIDTTYSFAPDTGHENDFKD